MTSTPLVIGDRVIGPGQPAFLIAEVAQAHDGSLGQAHAFIDAAAASGADAIKFQTHFADQESTLDEPFRVKFSRQDETRYAYWRRMEFTPEQWAGLAAHAAERALVFLSSPFSLKAVEVLRAIGMPAWKVASGELNSLPLLEAMAANGAPFLISSGMSPWAEIADTVATIRRLGAPLGLMQCTSRYPTPLEQVGLNVILDMRARFQCPVGLSDHSGSLWPALAAIAQGADMIEAHITLSRRHQFGPDAPASLTVEEFSRLAEGRDAFAAMAANPVDKDRMAAELAPLRKMFGRSVAPAEDLAAGTVLAERHLMQKKPGTGIPWGEVGLLIGRRLARAVPRDRLLSWEDVESDG